MENKKLLYLSKLKQKKYRDLENKYLIEGKHLIEEAEKFNLVEEKFSLEEKKGYEKLSISEMKKLITTDSLVSEVALVKKNGLNNKKLSNHVIALDKVQDPGNLGTIVRTMIAFSFYDLIMDNNSCDIYNPKVIRATQGGIFQINHQEVELFHKLLELKHQGYKIIGTALRNAKSLNEFSNKFDFKNNKFVIVMGNEGNGISKEILDICDELVFIEMDNIESLNVAISLAIVLYEIKNIIKK